MTDKEMTNEELEKMREDFFMPQATNDFGKIICFKCKPTYNFQSIEFEWYGTKNDLEEMFDIYKALLNELMAFAPEQNKTSTGPAKELASAKQREIMDRFHLKYKSSITKEEAQELIKKSIEEANK